MILIDSNPVEILRSKIETYLRENNHCYEVRSDGDFWIRKELAIVIIHPFQLNEKSLVKIASPVSLDIKTIPAKLANILLKKNADEVFGRFVLIPQEKVIWFEHILLGDNLNSEELITAIKIISSTANANDEWISNMTGGKTVIET